MFKATKQSTQSERIVEFLLLSHQRRDAMFFPRIGVNVDFF